MKQYTQIQYDILIIGSGPAGYPAAIRASQLGFKVAIVENADLGGICLNWGCIPTKALLRSAEIYLLAKNSAKFGVVGTINGFDLDCAVKRSRNVASKLSKGIEILLKKNCVTTIYGKAKLLDSNTVQITQQINIDNTSELRNKNGQNDQNDQNNTIILRPKHIIIATGAHPKELPTLKIDHKFVLDYKDAMMLTDIPKSLLIIGSGAIGIEFASFYNSINSKVTIVEIADRILLTEDKEIANFAYKSFTSQGIDIHLNTICEINQNINQNINQHSDIDKNVENTMFSVILNNNHTNTKITKKFDKIILAIGVTPNTKDLGIENTRVILENGFIKVNNFMETDDPNIYAIGDVTTAPLLAHKATHQGILCVEKIANLPNIHPILKENIPGCIYSYPQIASIGYTEEEALKKGYKVKIGRFPGIASGKLVAIEETEALFKTIFDEDTGELLGAHLIGYEVTELISNFAFIKQMEGLSWDMIAAILPHPTISESIQESTLEAYKKAIHI